MKSNVPARIADAKKQASRLAQEAKKAAARFQAARKTARAAKVRVKLARRALKAARKSKKQLKRTAAAAHADWRKAARKVSRLEKKTARAKAVGKSTAAKTPAHRARVRTRRIRPKLALPHPASKAKRTRAKESGVLVSLGAPHAGTAGTNQGSHSSSSFGDHDPSVKISAAGAECAPSPAHTPFAPAPENVPLRISETSSLSHIS